MPDLEKVIKELESQLDDLTKYADADEVLALTQGQAKDILALLKEQESIPMVEVEDDDLYAWSPEDVSYYCPRPECEKEISYDYNFCPYCGQAVRLNGFD